MKTGGASCRILEEDPFTLAVIQAALSAAADEMFLMLRRTAMSPIIYEVLDAGTGVTDGDGNLAGSGAGIPTFVGVLDKAVQRILAIHDGGGIAEGDMFVTNDPNYGGVTHLSDVVICHARVCARRADRLDGIDCALERHRRDDTGLDVHEIH